MDLFGIEIILVVEPIGFEPSCSTLMSHSAYAEVIPVAAVYGTALQWALQTGVGYFVLHSHALPRSHLLEHTSPAGYFSNHFSCRRWVTKKRGSFSVGCSHGIFFSPCWTKYDKASLFVNYALVISWILSIAPVIAADVGSGMACVCT